MLIVSCNSLRTLAYTQKNTPIISMAIGLLLSDLFRYLDSKAERIEHVLDVLLAVHIVRRKSESQCKNNQRLEPRKLNNIRAGASSSGCLPIGSRVLEIGLDVLEMRFESRSEELEKLGQLRTRIMSIPHCNPVQTTP